MAFERGSTARAVRPAAAWAGPRPGGYGRVVRIPLRGADRRIFTPTPWGSPSWQRGYTGRSAPERIDSRIGPAA